MRPSEVLGRNFWFCSIDDPGNVDAVIKRMGPDHIMVESDFPHADSTWPNTMAAVKANFGHLPPEILRKVTAENAAALFDVPLPPELA